MSQVKLNLQPPPNVDFVTGYPGIPPGPDRPQASVKVFAYLGHQAVEVRVPQTGVKAKWVRIELRKVETLPGGGPGNTYHDNVGPSPVPLWTSSDEYGHLRSQDFPFSIRIPESIAPTIALDNKAGIGYELLASVCTKGKRGFLRKAKSVVVSVSSPVIIDKHELHSTWPVYCQQETRHLEQDGVNLIVERNRTCFGPGDRISVMATVKSDSLHTVILRGFEIALRETTVFRPGLMPGKRTAPLSKQTSISENKVPVNQTLYGGTTHSLELACMVPANHTTPTLTSARYIDVTYTLCVRALMGTGTHVLMELPIMISNWQREVSFEAISRIGPTPGLSLLANAAHPTPINTLQNAPLGRPADAVAATLPINRSGLDSGFGNHQASASNAYTTMPGPSGSGSGVVADEFGARPNISTSSSNPATIGGSTTANHVAGTAASGSTTSPARRPNSAGGNNRFTVTNLHPSDGATQPKRNPSANATGAGSGSTQGRPWISAAEEKQLYEQARQNVVKLQGPAAAPPPVSTSATPPPVNASPPPAVAALPSSSTPTGNPQWISAQEEKRLFEQARAAVEKTHGIVPVSPPAAAVAAPSSSHTKQFSSEAPSASKPSGAALYAEAINARSRNPTATPVPAPVSGSSVAGGSRTTNLSPLKPNAAIPYLTADQEKAALRRYEEAKLAVDRTQRDPSSPPIAGGSSNSAPIAYESLFPAVAAPAPAPSSQPPPIDASPPPFESATGPNNIMAQLSEKERMRRQYELQDAAAMARQKQASPPPPVAYTSPPPPAAGPPTPAQYANALEEKEAMRRKFELRDAQMAARQNPAPPSFQVASPTPQPLATRTNGTTDSYGATGSPSRTPNPSSPPAFRPTPQPPTSPAAGGSSRILTAAEEKALLKAKYEMRDAPPKKEPQSPQRYPTNGASPSYAPAPYSPSGMNGAPPPPLMPRPPASYIQETQEEDARLSRLNGNANDPGRPMPNGSGSSSGLNGY
ncbi:hypothetical protein CPB83DRAFT_580351 [Crepidotus variabilis]|uniref:Arrestin C-terminal-like domain-containing protein n=1 Tax=Crepidotus variabilis TaxID=179855 RepID=A0A9P6JUA3_9AGAR|nr:hypothetical protein CPB83DRAFT_580351 [Crepidotus variabilis]